jgi:serine/threonine-protein kinase
VSASELPSGALVRGRYEVLGKIGSGGMADVYRARHVAFDELRALKVVSPRLLDDPEFMQRFRHEAAVARKLQHPNAVRVDDLDSTEDGRPFIVMELLEGRSLREVVHEEGPLAVPRALEIARQAALALQAAHELGIVHRDVKPDNLLLVRCPDGSEVCKVADFGIAKAREGLLGSGVGYAATQTGVVVGTPQYLAPEQIAGPREGVDGRADLYSLGVTLYELLTGRLPFESDTGVGMMMHHLQTPPRPPQLLRPDLPAPVAGLLLRALQKDPGRRCQSAAEFAAALQVLIASPATLVSRPTAPGSAPDISQSPTAALDRPPVPLPGVTASGRASDRATVQPQARRTPAVPPAEPRPSRAFGPALALLIAALCYGGWVGWQRSARPPAVADGSDSALAAEVQQRLAGSSLLIGGSIAVRCTAGAVTLEGRVPRESDADIAQKLAAGVAGVRSVTSLLAVGEPRPAPRDEPAPSTFAAQPHGEPAPRPRAVDDRGLREQVQRALAGSEELRGDRLQVRVSGGVAEIEGQVRTNAEADTVQSLARGVEGLRGLSLRLTVEPQDARARPQPARAAALQAVREALRRGDREEARRLLAAWLQSNPGDSDFVRMQESLQRQVERKRP